MACRHIAWKGRGDRTLPRWRRIWIDGLIWKSNNWSGNIHAQDHMLHEDDEFKIHIENLLNTQCQVGNTHTIQSHDESTLTIPVLDELFTVQKLNQLLKDVNVNKIYIDMCPEIIMAFLVNRFLFFLHVFNVFFVFDICYPMSWDCRKLFVLFKGGRDRLTCGSYRDISIMNT